MVPINEVLIAKIVLGYLSSRELSNTADCFVKECQGFHSAAPTGDCGKERILNHLEGLNLLPSLEEILNDYFAYKGPDDHTSDKVYMLWKQLDVVIGQLRAITLGKNKSKAFMNTRRAPRTYHKLVEKAEHCNQNNVNQFIANSNTIYNGAISDLQDSQKVPHKDLETHDFLFESGNVMMPLQNKLLTPVKQNIVDTNNKKEFRSPRRKPRHPRRNANGDTHGDDKVQSMQTETSCDVHLNKEFSDLVATLISSDRLSMKLADNINKVVSVEPKPPCKENEEDIVDEIIKLTADDPDLNVLFSMLEGQPNVFHDSATSHFDINSSISPNLVNIVSSTSNNYKVLHTSIISSENESIEVIDKNLPSSASDNTAIAPVKSIESNVQPVAMQSSTYPNFFELINSELPCMRDLSHDFEKNPLKTSNTHTHSENKVSETSPLILKTVDTDSSILTKISVSNEGMKNATSISTGISVEISPNETLRKDNCEKNKEIADDSEILASHALLQLSTSPMKVPTSNKVGNVISKPPVSPQALSSNRKINREPICSTNYNVQMKSDNLSSILNEDSSQNSQITKEDCSMSVGVPDADVSQPPVSSVNSFHVSLNNEKVTSLKRIRKKASKNVNLNPENTKIINTLSLETDELLQKKTKRSKEILVKQLDFNNPQSVPVPSNRVPFTHDKNSSGQYLNNICYFAPILTTSNMNMLPPPNTIVPIIYPKMSLPNVCDELSPLAMLSAQINAQHARNQFQNNIAANTIPSQSISKKKSTSVTHWSHVPRESSPVKSSNDQFQTFRIKGNAISKVDSESSSCSKSKTLSMVINNTDSLTKISTCSMKDPNKSKNISHNLQSLSQSLSKKSVLNRCVYSSVSSAQASSTCISSVSHISENTDKELLANQPEKGEQKRVLNKNNVENNVVVKKKMNSSDRIKNIEKRSKKTDCQNSKSNLVISNKTKKEKHSKQDPCEIMTVKFNFSRSASRKKSHSSPETKMNVKEEKEESSVAFADACEQLVKNPVCPVSDDSPRNINSKSLDTSDSSNSSNSGNYTDSVVDCLKASCKFQVSSYSSLDQKQLDKENFTNTSVTSSTNTPTTSQIPLSASQSGSADRKNDERSDTIESSKMVRQKKRKRRLSMLMLNVDNVAQLLSGIDYS